MRAAPKPTEQRDTGISVLGGMPWSAHFSLFYETTADLLDTVVPYFKTGLEAGELCVWLPSKPSMERAAEAALRSLVPDFDQHLAHRNVEFSGAKQWYDPDGRVDVATIMGKWHEMEERIRQEGYAGLRASGDMSWLGRAEWGAFSEYEQALQAFLPNRRMIVLCTYPLAGRRATDLLDSVRAHHVAVARRKGAWELIETPSLKKTKEQIQRLNEDLEQRVAERTRQLARSEAYLEEGQRLNHSGSFAIDVATGDYTYMSPENYRIFGLAPGRPVRHADTQALIHPDDHARIVAAYETLLKESRDATEQFRIVRPDGRVRYLYKIWHPVLDRDGRVVEVVGTDIDITDRMRASAKLARVKRAARERALEARFAAALEERTRLAREIHDSLLQGVTGIALQLRATLPRLKTAQTAATSSIRAVVDLAETTIRDARRAVWDMRAPSLVQKGLATALEEGVRRTAGDLKLDFVIEGKPRPLRPEAVDTIYRVGQEAVLNSVKHAEARHVTVKLVYKPRSATLTIADDGHGFSVDEAFRAYAGRWGLLGMRERADRIGAALTIRSTAREGTIIKLHVSGGSAKAKR